MQESGRVLSLKTGDPAPLTVRRVVLFAAALLVMVSGCASLPKDYPREPSRAGLSLQRNNATSLV